ncbi:hypothetical protein [Pseudoalteromonas sp. S558]|uniref:hypothetical protein n=1 Tax=Pseudoalteromonas sp. S558 TaxID=2066515 RepID=UPI00110A1E1C|nr:hypothetical protein [Pseudoalteromonas sp. S558]TMO09587.1 hypothetical protein CWB66_01640 [Pseudoalteromonas sp. S558]
MKSIILAGLVASASAFISLPTYAQTDTAAKVQNESMNSLINILSNVTAQTSPEQLEKDLLEAITRICKNNEKNQLDETIPYGSCSPANIDGMISAVIASFGVDSPLISNFLAALSAYGVDSDTITIAAITAGIDATVASEATAAGPVGTQPAPPVIVALPTLPVSPGAGGTGGDTGISEVGN